MDLSFIPQLEADAAKEENGIKFLTLNRLLTRLPVLLTQKNKS